MLPSMNSSYANSSIDYDESSNFTVEELHANFAFKLGDLLVYYWTPLLVLFGCGGNILSVNIILKTNMKKLSSSYYLVALGISDTCFLLTTFVTWLNYFGMNISNREYYCQFFTFISSLCSFLSAWFVVGFTLERFIAVTFPLKRETMCTVGRTCKILIGLIVAGSLMYIPQLLFYSPQLLLEGSDLICDARESLKVSS